MMGKLSELKMKLYCMVVNQNRYVREAYQLPVDLDKEYHQRHRVREWLRLLKLLLKYRILHREPSEEEWMNLREMQEKKEQLFIQQAIAEKEDDASELRRTVTEAIHKLREADLLRCSERENVIIWGDGSGGAIPLLVKNITGFSGRFQEAYRFIWLRNREKTDEKPTFATFYYPWLLMEESGFSTRECEALTDDEERLLSRYIFLQDSAAAIEKECPGMNDVYARLISHEIYRYFSAALEYLKPRLFLVWEEAAWVSLITKNCCEESGIPCAILRMDYFGLVYRFDSISLPGDNVLVRYPDWTVGLSGLTDEELRSANEMIECLKAKKSRAGNDLNSNLPQIDISAPLIFVCGKERFGEGKAEAFTSFYEVILCLAEICRKNRWNLIYRFCSDDAGCKMECSGRLPSNAIDSPEYDVETLIDRCDVFVTVDSELSCYALLNKKPVVLLGYSGISGRGCCYEAFGRDKVSDVIQTAVHQGMTDCQYEHFLKYIAFLGKYYFYSAYTDADIKYGQPIEKLAAYFESVIDGTAPF